METIAILEHVGYGQERAVMDGPSIGQNWLRWIILVPVYIKGTLFPSPSMVLS